MNKKWNNEEIEFLKEHYNDMTLSELCSILDRTKSSVHVKANKLGIKKEEKYFYNKNFFNNIDSEEKAYWLGFIVADGYVIHNTITRNYELGIELNRNDKKHLIKFNKALNGNIKVTETHSEPRFIKGNPVRETFGSVIRIYNKNIVESLINLGCVKNKSKIVGLPNVNDDLMRHVLRGIFDGDGCIRSNTKYIRCDITTASNKMIKDVREYLYVNGIYTHVYETRKGSECYKIDISGKKNVLNFLSLIYYNCNVYLDRKFNLYNKLASLHSDV